MKPMVETIWWNPRMKSIKWMSLAMCIGIQPLWTTLFSTMYFFLVLPMFWNFIILINIIHIIEFHPFNQFHQYCHLPPFIKFTFIYVCVFQLCDKFHDHTFIHMVSPFFFVANFHNLEIVSATFMEDFLRRKWPKVRFRGKEVFLLSQNSFLLKK